MLACRSHRPLTPPLLIISEESFGQIKPLRPISKFGFSFNLNPSFSNQSFNESEGVLAISSSISTCVLKVSNPKSFKTVFSTCHTPITSVAHILSELIAVSDTSAIYINSLADAITLNKIPIQKRRVCSMIFSQEANMLFAGRSDGVLMAHDIRCKNSLIGEKLIFSEPIFTLKALERSTVAICGERGIGFFDPRNFKLSLGLSIKFPYSAATPISSTKLSYIENHSFGSVLVIVDIQSNNFEKTRFDFHINELLYWEKNKSLLAISSEGEDKSKITEILIKQSDPPRNPIAKSLEAFDICKGFISQSTDRLSLISEEGLLYFFDISNL